ncbi:SHOCT domain-containing protein [Halostella sp. JP-L12]|uniref:SHOCT domain-containing protein n=1 Tax=Halostella TaxID=1843185 RepID=UPI000EF7D29C|nr:MULTISPECIES: SHOCT domain-containing protein [Halostella]NHN49200.1 SHOCT domain-containing protein [Halostella sp. JP-L12]
MPETTDDTRLVAIVLLIIGALAVLPMFFMGFGMMGYGPMMGGMWDRGTAPGWMLVASVVIRLLFLGALIGGGYLVYRALTGSDGDSDRALEELRLAYARGDLTDEEYEQRRDSLERDT